MAVPTQTTAPPTAPIPGPISAPVGGPRLGERGRIWNPTYGVSDPPGIQASSYLIADAESGQILAAKDPHGSYLPASTLKILTSITLIPRLDPNKAVSPSQEAVNTEGSAVGLSTGWKYTVRQLLYGLLMASGNDASIALSEANGGVAATITQMNAEARRLQALDTIAATPNGLDDNLTISQQRSSAYDLGLMMRQGLKLPDFVTYTAQTVYDWPAPPTSKDIHEGRLSGGWQIQTHDHLLLPFDRYHGMIGGKNGWTPKADGTFVGAAKRGGHTIIASLMHAQSDFWSDERKLLDWGFEAVGKVQPVGTLVPPIPPHTASPRARTAKKPPHAGERLTSSGSRPWLLVTLSIGATTVLAVVLAFGLHRKNRPGTGAHLSTHRPDGPPEADTDPLPPVGDVKVAGSPEPPPAYPPQPPPGAQPLPGTPHAPATQQPPATQQLPGAPEPPPGTQPPPGIQQPPATQQPPGAPEPPPGTQPPTATQSHAESAWTEDADHPTMPEPGHETPRHDDG